MENMTNNGGQYSPEEIRRRKGSEFFGFELRDKIEKLDSAKSFVPKLDENEPAYVTAAGGFYGQVLDIRGDNFANDRDLIVKYRSAAMHPEVDQAIEDIINEMIVANDSQLPVSLNMDFVDTVGEKTKEKIQEQFDFILQLLDFRKYGHDIARRWYIDGRLAYHLVIDMKDPKKGILELRPINPLKIKKIKEVIEDLDTKTGSKFIVGTEEYFVYSEDGFTQGDSVSLGNGNVAKTGLKIPVDSIAYVTSGIMDTTRRSSLSYLHKALKSVNQLRFMEDSLVIYRLSRAPERRLFYIDVGDMPKAQAQAYVNNIMKKYQNKLTYDASSGEVKDGRKQMHMLEDFWLPRSSSGKGTEVSSLPGGQNLGQIEDIEYFQKKLYQSLNVPINRLDPEVGFHIGRSTEINRDEVRFSKFIDRLRLRFSDLFIQTLRIQLILKGIVTAEEWDEISENIIFDYARDSFFTELKEIEIMRERLSMLSDIESFIGTYFSKEYVRKNILKQTVQEIKEIKHQIRSESITNDGLPNPEEDLEGSDIEGGGDFEGDFGDFENNEFENDEQVEFGDPEGASTALGPDDDLDKPEEEFDDESEENT